MSAAAVRPLHNSSDPENSFLSSAHCALLVPAAVAPLALVHRCRADAWANLGVRWVRRGALPPRCGARAVIVKRWLVCHRYRDAGAYAASCVALKR